MIVPDAGASDNVVVADDIRVTVDHNLKMDPFGDLQFQLADRDKQMKRRSRELKVLPDISRESWKYKSLVPGFNVRRYTTKDCNVPTSLKVSAARNVVGWPRWVNQKSIAQNVARQKLACLNNEYSAMGGFCFDEKDREAPWCYWPKINCDFPEQDRHTALHYLNDYPSAGADRQQEVCTESGFCYERGARPACYIPKL